MSMPKRIPRSVRAMLAGASALLALSFATRAGAQESDLASLRAAAKANPQDAAASFALGKALRRAGHFPEAVAELGHGALMGSATKAGLVSPIRYELARVKIDQRDLGGAIAACNALSKALAAACRAEAHLMQNRATEAMPEAQKALELEASLYEGKVAEGRSLSLMGKVTEAEAALRAAASSTDGRPEAHLSLGVFLLAQGKRDAGIAELKKARAADASDPVIAFQLGEALGATKEGRDAFAAAAKIRPTFAAAHAGLARAALGLGDLPAAEASAIEAVKQDPKLFAAHVALGTVRVAQARWDDAMKEGEAAKKLIPNSASGELIVADAHAGKGDIDLAVESYQKAFGLDRTDPTPLVRAAHGCTAAGRYTTAKGFADRVTSDFPKWGPGWVELGDLAAKQGDKAKARSAYETALKGEGPVDKAAVQKKLAALK